jgi:hypothetical protein
MDDWMGLDAVSRLLNRGKYRLQLKPLESKSLLESSLAGKTGFLRRFGTGNEQRIQFPVARFALSE